jgi:hypothetical protein
LQAIASCTFFAIHSAAVPMKMKFLWALWLLVCNVACFLHIIALTLQYMSYDISTSVRASNVDQIMLPDVTICNEMLIMSNTSNNYFRENCDHILQRHDCQTMGDYEIFPLLKNLTDEAWTPIIDRLINRFTTKQLLQQVSVNARAFITKHERFKRDKWKRETFSDLRESFDVYDSLLSYRRCYTLQWTEGLQREDYWLLRRKAVNNFLGIYLDTTFVDPMTLILIGLTENRKLPSVSSTDFVTSSPEARARQVKFDLMRSKFLPQPFATNCIDYNETTGGKISSRDECFESCYAPAHYRRHRKIPMLLRRDKKYADFTSTTYTEDSVHPLDVSDLYFECQRKCDHPDCNQVDYLLTVMSTSELSVHEDKYEIQFYVSSSPVIRREGMPAISLETFITAVSSTFGFWLGVSVFSIGDIIHLISRNVRRTCKRKQRGQGSIRNDRGFRNTHILM